MVNALDSKSSGLCSASLVGSMPTAPTIFICAVYNMSKQLKPLEIDRAKWLTGEATEKCHIDSQLLCGYTGLMCCLGFVAKKEGFTDAEIENVSDFGKLASLSGKANRELEKLFPNFNDIDEKSDTFNALQNAMVTNDMVSLSRDVRERKIVKILSNLGYAVTFTGEYPTYERVKGANNNYDD